MNERKVIFSMMVSLDGFMEGPGQDITWHGMDEELHRYMNQREDQMGVYLFGRGLYENMEGFWSKAENDPTLPEVMLDYVRIWKRMPKVVFSTTLESVGENARLVRDDIAGEVRRLKAQPGGNMGLGGAILADSFARLGLIDEYEVFVNPIILGSGKRMFFENGHTIPLELLETRTFPTGVTHLRYRALNK